MFATLEDIKFERFLRHRKSGTLHWKTKEGSIIPIESLSDEHLENIINAYKQNKENSTTIQPSSFNFY